MIPAIAWLPIAMGAGSLIGSLFGGGSKPPPNNQWSLPEGIDPNSDFGKYLATGIVPGSDQDRVTRSSGSSSSTTNASSSFWQNTKPTYHYGSQRLVDMLPGIMERRLLEGGKVSPAEKMGVLNQVGRQSSFARKAAVDQIRERGMGLSEPIAANVDANIGGAKTSAISNYLTRIPEIERARYSQEIGQMAQILQALFQGQATKGGSKSTSTTQGSSSSTTVQEAPEGGVFDPNALRLGITPGQRTPNWADILGMASNLGAGLWGAGAFRDNPQPTGATG